MSSPPDAIRFLCPKCSYRIKVAVDFAGKAGKCPKCLAPIRVPETSLLPAGADSTRERRDPVDSSKHARRPGRRGAPQPKERDPRDADAQPRTCRDCTQESPPSASECAGCGRPFGDPSPADGYPPYVDTIFTVSGWGMIVLGALNGLNAVLMLVGSKGGALIPAAIVGVVAGAMGRVGWGLREKNKLSLGVAAALGCLALFVNGIMALAALEGARIYLTPDVRIPTPVVFLSLLLTCGIYVPPVVVGLRFRREIEWS